MQGGRGPDVDLRRSGGCDLVINESVAVSETCRGRPFDESVAFSGMRNEERRAYDAGHRALFVFMAVPRAPRSASAGEGEVPASTTTNARVRTPKFG